MCCVSSLAHRVLFAARRSWCWSTLDGAYPLRGGAPCAQGAAVAPFGEGGGAAGAYAGGVPGGAGHCSGSGVDPEVVAVVAVSDVGFAYDGFDDGCVAVVVEGFESRTGSVGRVSDDVGSGWFTSDEVGAYIGVGGVGRGESHSSDQSGLGFGGYVEFPPVAGHFHKERVASWRMDAAYGEGVLLGGSRPRRKFSDEFKRDAVEIVRSSGKPIRQVAQELGIYDLTLR